VGSTPAGRIRRAYSATVIGLRSSVVGCRFLAFRHRFWHSNAYRRALSQRDNKSLEELAISERLSPYR
jgi:hypothetical protein